MREERDEQVTAAYRALGAEEPPRALDEAILAAARRAASSLPGPVRKPWAQRYAVPLSLAAVLVLSITVTLRIQHEAPELEKPVVVREQAVAQAPALAKEAAPAERDALRLKPEVQMKSAPVARAEPKPFADATRRAPEASAAAPAVAPAGPARQEEFASRADQVRGPEPGAGGAAMRQAEERLSRDAEAASRAASAGPLQALAKRSREVQEQQADAAARAAPPPAAAAPAPKPAAVADSRVGGVMQPRPEAELERIAQLRAEGRHDEADKALAEFRRRLPDYRIPDEMLKKVERR